MEAERQATLTIRFYVTNGVDSVDHMYLSVLWEIVLRDRKWERADTQPFVFEYCGGESVITAMRDIVVERNWNDPEYADAWQSDHVQGLMRILKAGGYGEFDERMHKILDRVRDTKLILAGEEILPHLPPEFQELLRKRWG